MAQVSRSFHSKDYKFFCDFSKVGFWRLTHKFSYLQELIWARKIYEIFKTDFVSLTHWLDDRNDISGENFESKLYGCQKIYSYDSLEKLANHYSLQIYTVDGTFPPSLLISERKTITLMKLIRNLIAVLDDERRASALHSNGSGRK